MGRLRRAWRVVARQRAEHPEGIPAMDGLHEFAQPQLLAGILAFTLLSLAAGIEAVVLGLSLRQRFSPHHGPHGAEPSVHEAVGQDFYDWLYE